MKGRGIGEVLAEAQARLRRLTPTEAASAVREGATLIDTRDGDLRSRDGHIPGSVHIPLSVLEWRGGPTPGHPSGAGAGGGGRAARLFLQGCSARRAAARRLDPPPGA